MNKPDALLVAVQKCDDLPMAAVLLALENYSNTDGMAWPSINTLSEVTGLSRKVVTRRIEALQTSGLIIFVDRVNKSSKFFLTHNTPALPLQYPFNDPSMYPLPSQKGDIREEKVREDKRALGKSSSPLRGSNDLVSSRVKGNSTLSDLEFREHQEALQSVGL